MVVNVIQPRNQKEIKITIFIHTINMIYKIQKIYNHLLINHGYADRHRNIDL